MIILLETAELEYVLDFLEGFKYRFNPEIFEIIKGQYTNQMQKRKQDYQTYFKNRNNES